MQRPYPKGAISSINELLTYANKPIWAVSRAHSNQPEKQLFTGEIFTKKFEDGYLYYGYYFLSPSDRYKFDASLLDKHVIAHPNGDYNDWYLFGNEEDAKAYLEEIVHETA